MAHTIKVEDVRTIGRGLVRPEGVMALDDGTVRTAHGWGGCATIHPGGRTTFSGSLGGVPNGICIDGQGRTIVANIGNGELQALADDGSHSVLLTEAEGRRLWTPNFPFIDMHGRLWVTNSTDDPDVDAAIQDPRGDGCLVLLASGRPPRIVADRIFFANGVALDAEERFVYVAETMKRRILRYRIEPGDALGPAEVYGPDPLGDLGHPDGIAFDEGGNLWITFPAGQAVGYIDPAGALVIALDDPRGAVIRRPTNICFGGRDRRTAFVGSLGGQSVPCFEVPYPGVRLVHQTR